jgi:CBS domain-containing protein
MTRELQTIAEGADFWDAIDQMRRNGIRRLPVVNEAGGLEGILTLDDALELISEALAGLVGLVSRERDLEASSRPAR